MSLQCLFVLFQEPVSWRSSSSTKFRNLGLCTACNSYFLGNIMYIGSLNYNPQIVVGQASSYNDFTQWYKKENIQYCWSMNILRETHAVQQLCNNYTTVSSHPGMYSQCKKRRFAVIKYDKWSVALILYFVLTRLKKMLEVISSTSQIYNKHVILKYFQTFLMKLHSELDCLQCKDYHYTLSTYRQQSAAS
jgi:hypothetical protein